MSEGAAGVPGDHDRIEGRSERETWGGRRHTRPRPGCRPAPAPGSGPVVGFQQWDYAPGRCYSWPRGSASALVHDVPCEGVHHFEAVGSTTIREDYPTDAAYPTSTCLRRESGDLFVEVPCDAPHHAESTGPLTAPETDDGARPSDTWLSARIGPQCTSIAAPYLEVGYFGDALVDARWSFIGPESWQTGTRRTTCFIGFADEAGSPVPVTGSITAPVI